jgi:hypothetical protein
VKVAEQPRTTWTDERLDDLSDRNTRMDVRLTGSIEKLEGRCDVRFDKVDATLHDIQRSMLGVQRTMIVVLVAVVGLVAAGHL